MRILLLFSLLVLNNFAIWCQSNDLIDTFLGQKNADVATSLLLVGQASGALMENATIDQAYLWAGEERFGKKVLKLEQDAPIPMGLFYLIMFESFNVKGGIWYTILHSPRQAALEAAYKGYIDSSTLYYNRKMTPYEVLTSLTIIQEGGNW
ncbi:MAG: hypothetical protein PF518_04010 [Spirochaetaceae bacterium]|jgi:hypothetical protein|nr:hypothetical protein [Spirochaetaceae bacterium]